MTRRILELRERYAADAEAVGILDQLAREPELHWLHGDTSACLLRRASSLTGSSGGGQRPKRRWRWS